MKNFFHNLLSLLSVRFALLSTELGQVKDALVSVLLCGIAALIFSCLGLISLSVLFVIYTWPLLGLLSLAIIAGLYWLIAIIFISKIWRVLAGDQLKLKVTLRELRLDKEAIFPKDPL